MVRENDRNKTMIFFEQEKFLSKNKIESRTIL